MQNESVHILRIHGMNLDVYGVYTELGKSSNGILLSRFTECVHMWNESVCVVIIHGTNLYVYRDYEDCTKSRIPWQI
jgi:hypothetical protein